MKKFLILLLFPMYAHAALYGVELEDVTSCNSSPDPNTFYSHFTREYGLPYKNEGGAFWWKTKNLVMAYGTRVREVFVSSDYRWSLVGIVLEGKPDKLIPFIAASQFTGGIIKRDNYWDGVKGQSIRWHQQEYTKVFCLVRNPFL